MVGSMVVLHVTVPKINAYLLLMLLFLQSKLEVSAVYQLVEFQVN